MVDDVCVAFSRGEHEGRLVVFIEGDAGVFVAELEEEGDDREVAELGGEV